MKEKSLTHGSLIFQQSPFTATHYFRPTINFIPCMKKVSDWLLILLRTASSASASDEQC